MKPEKIEELLVKIEKIQSILIDVATCQSKICDEEESYKKIYQEIDRTIGFLSEDYLNVINPNNFDILRKWYEFYDENNLNTAERLKYIYELYSDVVNQVENHLYTNFDKYKVKSNLDDFDIIKVEKLVKKVEIIQDIMIDVATGKSKPEDEEEDYIKIWKDAALQIRELEIIGFPITNPNNFRCLSHWKAHYSCELEKYQYRRDYVNDLYSNIINPINKATTRYHSIGSSVEDFVGYLKRYLTEAQSIPSISKLREETDQMVSTKNINASSPQRKIKELESISNSDLTELRIISPVISTGYSSQNEFYNNRTDVVILTALPKERDAILKYLESPQIVEYSGRTFHKASIETSKSETVYQAIILCLPSMGNNQAAIATQRAISEFNPSHIILVGIAGGVPKENSRYLGDIIVGEQIVDYALNKRVQAEQGHSQNQPRYQIYRPARVLLEAAKNLPLQNWAFCVKAQRPDGTTGRVNPAVHFGVIASGNTVIADQDLRDELKNDWSQLVGIEMEGAGAALAAYESDFMPGIFLVKGMCDWADGSKNDDWQQYAAETAASFVVELLRTAPFESTLELHPQSNHVSNQEALPQSNLKPQNLVNENPVKATSTVTTKNYSGKIKISICNKLVRDWEDLADYFDIKLHERETFDKGKEARRVWEWLEQRTKLHELEDAFIAIGREDLVEELNK
ncbi:MAG: 5'-methylthioadenosine/S-adenosylhomocysteine nucleosidase [Richelia sp. RM2_1_2]|nr:5'-methylthioadenosine/S-adenosylhomocysteine nucleosidase [Richelia sp. RM1_1_1]NJO56823.1 5'-methylthioadenosine/S-adenosylhomocysteine nucleosidase [Richelia sp. RM2_1_2]